MQPLIVIGQPGDKRTGGIQQARRRLGLPPALVVPYAQLLQGNSLQQLLAEQGWPPPHPAAGPEAAGSAPGSPAALLRLESPGGSFAVERAIIALGAPDAEDSDDSLHPHAHRADPRPLSVKTARQLRELPGVLHHPSQWFRGYCRLLARLAREARTILPQARWVNDPAEVAAMTDKRRAQQLLGAAGVPVPRPLGSGAQLEDYASLREAMLQQRMHRVFIKLACGSAASGVMAYQVHPATGAEVAVTTVGVEHYITRPPVYYNSGKLRQYTDPATIRGIIDWICRHGAYAEQWIPKSSSGGKAFDIRQLVVMGEACHAVARVSSSPITNLHLRSERMTPGEAGLSAETQARVRGTAEQALAAFPGSAIAGVDVLVAAGSQRTYVADINPFGDLLYGVEYGGLGTYEWEMQALTVKERYL
ncbi:STM4014 family protein [Paenibacillus donghaensis]|uniref:ATP-grasp domain-containing protein n=1 Tax=Paenibacillus donghaensis TaxID=414771 RepID=A0A2Z2KFA0_9BACL|nr:STM4014 family protein [Paenibacillus donghaensis]ASA19422.1 hypothetical protein B9T62_00250 [Paenibacillus donghaensis]